MNHQPGLFILAILLTTPALFLASKPRCTSISCSDDLQTLTQRSPRTCQSCDDCYVDGYSVCVTNARSKSDVATSCFCSYKVIDDCEFTASKADSAFSGTLCYQWANRPLPPPELSIMDDAVFVQNPEYLSQQSYWKSFNIVNASLYYEFPTKNEKRCTGAFGKLVVPSVEDLTRANAGQPDQNKFPQNCKFLVPVGRAEQSSELGDGELNLTSGIVMEKVGDEEEYDDDDSMLDFSLDTAKYNIEAHYEIIVDQPGQLKFIGNTPKVTNKRTTIKSQVVNYDLNWDAAEEIPTEESRRKPSTTDDTTTTEFVETEPSSQSTKMPISTRPPIPAESTTEESTEELPDLPSPPSEEDTNDSSMSGANLALYIFLGVLAIVLIAASIAVCCCRKRCCGEREQNQQSNGHSKTTNSSVKSVNGKRYLRAPV